MEVFPGRWMARVRNLGSDLLSFGAARQEAVRLYRCRDKGTIDWICQLNLRVAAEISRTALASDKRKTPVDLIGGERQGHVDPKIRATVLDAEIGFLWTLDRKRSKATTTYSNTTQMAIQNYQLAFIDVSRA